jgi:hypothetical protein
MADALPDDRVLTAMSELRSAYRNAALALPANDIFLAHVVAAAVPLQ